MNMQTACTRDAPCNAKSMQSAYHSRCTLHALCTLRALRRAPTSARATLAIEGETEREEEPFSCNRENSQSVALPTARARLATDCPEMTR